MINDMLAQAIKEVENAGIRTGWIDNNVTITKATKVFGHCKKEGHKFTIALSKYFIDNPRDEVMNTLIHEVLHTVDGCFNHGDKWKRMADIVNKKYGYNVTRTSKHKMNGLKEIEHITRRYVIKCEGCGQEIVRQRKSKLVDKPQLFRCGKCDGRLKRVL